MKLKVVATYLTEFEAVSAQNALNDSGIESYIESAASITALSYIGTALSGVRLVVRAEDEEAARQFLADSQSNSPAQRWICANCSEENEASFDLCWRCNSERSTSATGDIPEAAQEATDATQNESSVESKVNRAWLAAVLGSIMPLLTIYSMYLLFTIDERLISDRKYKLYYHLAWCINFTIICLWLLSFRFSY